MKITITKLDEGFTVSVKEGDAIVTKRAFESLNTALSFAERQLGGQPPAEAERPAQPEERLAEHHAIDDGVGVAENGEARGVFFPAFLGRYHP